MKRYATSLLGMLTSIYAWAGVTLPHFFEDGMVLQRETEAKIWGTARPGSTVTIETTWNKTKTQTKTATDGKWSARLRTPEAGGPYEIRLNDGDKTTTVVRDVLIGEVWLCSGQSNMEMPIEGYKGQPVDNSLAILLECQDDNLRIFQAERASRLTPQDTLVGEWKHANAESVSRTSATAYLFAKQLRANLHIPVGIVIVSWGGSSCETWMREEWLDGFENIKVPRTQKEVTSAQRNPTLLYNGMLHPLIGMSMRGAIWYQGEDNIPRYKDYAAKMSALIKGWRAEWGIGDFPFYYCQIAPFDYQAIGWNTNSALLREQQCLIEKNVSNTGMIVLLDTGLEHGIHPSNKKAVGDRLCGLALKETYGLKGLPQTARYKRVTFTGDSAIVEFERSRMWIHFDHDGPSTNFEVAGEDQIFHPATAIAVRNKLIVRSPEVPHPIAVRYAFKNWVIGDLFCDGLPVSSFRTDNWDDEVQATKGKEYDVR